MNNWNNNQEPYVERNLREITFNKLNHPKAVSQFIREIKSGIEAGFKSFDIFIDNTSIFPNVAVPIAGLIDYYRKSGIIFNLCSDNLPCNIFVTIRNKPY